MRIEAVLGDITTEVVDARLQAAREALGGCPSSPPVGIHTVGPQWLGGGRGEDEFLASCYRRSLFIAAELGAHAVAFPAISTGEPPVVAHGSVNDRDAQTFLTTLSVLF